MRLEQITAMALEKVDHDSYLLAKAIGKRAEELNHGATPLVDMDVKKTQPTDIALLEIAEGKLLVSREN
jgi:DNA-directed RNA polymerase subunit K/omega